MSNVVQKTEDTLETVAEAISALESGDAWMGYELLRNVKTSSVSIIEETEHLLRRVSAVERYYRAEENVKARKIGDLYDLEQTKKQRKEKIRRTMMSKESKLLEAKANFCSVEEDRRRAKIRKEEAESSKNANIAGAVGAVGFGIAAVLTLGLSFPITVTGAALTGAAIYSYKAMGAFGDKDRAERDINRCTSEIRQYEWEIIQYSGEIHQLEREIDALSQEVLILKSERYRIHVKKGEISDSIIYLRNVQKFWKEFSQITVHGTDRATLLQRLSALHSMGSTRKTELSRQLQSCASAWGEVGKKLERGNEHLFSIDFTCHICGYEFHDLPHLSNGKFCCYGCRTI